MDRIDKKFAALGYVNVHESDLAVDYEKEVKIYGYTHCLDLCHKKNGPPIIQSYEKGLNKDGLNNMAGLTPQEAWLCIRKMWRKGWL